MKKSIITLALGIFIVVIISYAGPAWAAAKQYILNEVNYPVVVDGVTYKDSKNPILNYNGSTYIPLAKIGDLTGVHYKWNADKKQVEISTDAKTTSSSSTDGPVGRKNDYLKPDTEVEIVEPKVKGYNGVSDEEDFNYHASQSFDQNLPPLLSEGWVSHSLVYDVFNFRFLYGEGENYEDTVKFHKNYKVSLVLEFPTGWSNTEEQKETTVNGVRVKRYMSTNYYNISGLEKALGVKK